MTTVGSLLPRLFRWVFTVLAVFFTLGAAAIVVAILIHPHLPAGTHLGPTSFDFAGQPGSASLRPVNGDFDFLVAVLRGNVQLFVNKAGGFVDVIERHGLPVIFIDTLFFAVVFDLLRRLFRNVGRGESFKPESVRLVQFVGLWLIAFSIVSAIAEHWFVAATYTYLSGHTTVTVMGRPLYLPAADFAALPRPNLFDMPVFYSGLLVLALSEVFRQGLTLKAENDLTV